MRAHALARTGDLMRKREIVRKRIVLTNTFAQVSQDSRYIDNEELRFSLRSLEKFAPWVRRVSARECNKGSDMCVVCCTGAQSVSCDQWASAALA